MKANKISLLLALAALVFAAAASLLLIFLPFYQGVSSDSSTQKPVAASATLIEINGRWAVILLAIPVALTAVVVLAIWKMKRDSIVRSFAIWTTTTILIIFIIAAILSLGMFYAPATALMLAAAVLAGRKPKGAFHN